MQRLVCMNKTQPKDKPLSSYTEKTLFKKAFDRLRAEGWAKDNNCMQTQLSQTAKKIQTDKLRSSIVYNNHTTRWISLLWLDTDWGVRSFLGYPATF